MPVTAAAEAVVADTERERERTRDENRDEGRDTREMEWKRGDSFKEATGEGNGITRQKVMERKEERKDRETATDACCM